MGKIPYAAFFDLDGTLALHNEPPCPEDVAAMRAFRDRGNYLFLCTGRSVGYLYDAVTDIGFDGMVAGAGAHVTVGERVLKRTCVTPAQLDPVLRMFENTATNLIMEGETRMVQLVSPLVTQIIRSYPRIGSADEWYERYADEVVSKLTFYGGIPDVCIPSLEREFVMIRHGHYDEALPRGCSKSDGMQLVLESLGIPREHSIAFGDSMNDLDMIRYAGLGVAMGNAVDEVIKAADRVTLPVAQGGIAAVLNEIE